MDICCRRSTCAYRWGDHSTAFAPRCLHMTNPLVNSSMGPSFGLQSTAWRVKPVKDEYAENHSSLTSVFGLLEADPCGVIRSSTLFGSGCMEGSLGKSCEGTGAPSQGLQQNWGDPQVGWSLQRRRWCGEGGIGAKQNKSYWMQLEGSCCGIVSAGWAGSGESAVNPIPF